MKLFICCLVLFLSFFQPVEADGSELNIYYAENPPYSVSESLTGEGFLIDYAKEILSDADIEYNMIKGTWSESVNRAANDDYGVFLAGRYNYERSLYFERSSFIVKVDHSFFRRTNTEFDYNGDLRSLVGLRIGVIAGWQYEREFSEAGYLNKISYPDTTLGLVALYSGQIDLLVTDSLIANYTLTHHLPTVKYDVEEVSPLDRSSIYALFNKNMPGVENTVEGFNSSMLKLRQENRVEDIRNQYLN